MQDSTKNIIISVGFSLLIVIVLFVNVIVKDKEISISERRTLAKFPELSFEKVFNGDVADKFEKYSVDQFVGRDIFRSIKSVYSLNVFKQKDNNNLFIVDDAIYSMNYPLKEDNVIKSSEKINEIYYKYLNGMNVYYTIIPEKNYYLKNDDHLSIDYIKVKEIMNNNLTDLKFFDIENSLTLDDYYATDLHWKQENLKQVVNKIQTSMNLESTNWKYDKENRGEFFGTYYGQLGLNVPPDNIYTLTNNVLDNCIVYDYETQKNSKIYDDGNKADKYDIFLSGAKPLISIENIFANTDKELLMFRDSFGSSLAPLLVQNYRKITLIDIRYMSSKILDKYIDFNNQDVLFIYSTLVLNQNILR